MNAFFQYISNRPGLLSSVAFLLLAGGCSWFGGAAPQPETPPGPVTAFMVGAGTGENATLDDPDFGRGVKVSVDELFTSAKGEDCKRGTVLTDRGEAEVVVICRGADGRWTLAPRVWGQGISR